MSTERIATASHRATLGFMVTPLRWSLLLVATAVATAVFGGCTQVSTSPAAGKESATSSGRTVAEARPGLGTGWGEERNSATQVTSFVRSSTRPTATDRLYYNDREGVQALLRSSPERVQSASRVESVPGGYASWGVQGDGVGRVYKIGGDRVVVGEHGGRYEVVVRNETVRRLEAVISVDGLDVMDGRTASLAKHGYIIGPRSTLRVAGFRTSADTVAAFRFSSVAASYASLKHGDTRNVGVIGLAIFTERQPAPARGWAEPPPGYGYDYRAIESRRRAEPFPGR